MDKRIALITGASRGIGRVILEQLAMAGCYVIGTATSESGAQKIGAYIEEAGFAGEGQVLNIAEADSISALLANLKATSGMPEVLVNNAGITRDNLLMRMSDQEWSQVINTNLTGIFYLTKGCLRAMMKARAGRIISVGSVVGTAGNPGQANYCAAKAGVIGFSKSLAREVASRNITVNVVAPGFIQTDMTDVLSDEQKASLVKAIPMQRIGKPDDIAAVVNFLASKNAGYITGETIHVNGGMLMA